MLTSQKAITLSMHILDNEETLLLPSIWHQTVMWIHIKKGMLSFFYLSNKRTVYN